MQDPHLDEDNKPLTDAQLQSLEAFKQALEKEGINNKFRPQDYNDRLFLRWLRARKFDVNKSLEMIRGYCDWRERTGVEQYNMERCNAVLDTDACLFMGEDIYGRPTIIVRPAKHVPGSLPLDQVEALMVLTLEVAIRNLKNYNEHFILIFDYEGWGLKNVDKGVDNIILTVGQNNYPERLREAILVQPPWYFSTVWTVVKLFLDEKTKSKFTFLSKNIPEELSKRYTPENLLEKFGGTSKGLSVRQYLSSKMRDDKETLGEYIDRVLKEESQQQQQQEQQQEA